MRGVCDAAPPAPAHAHAASPSSSPAAASEHAHAAVFVAPLRVLLTSLSAKQVHKTLAPWTLKAYADAHLSGAGQRGVAIEVMEATINENLHAVAERIVSAAPDVIGFSLYVWNVRQTEHLAALVKKLLLGVSIWFGGPEVSFVSSPDAYPSADCIVRGPGELPFADLLRRLLAGDRQKGIFSSQEDPFPDLPTPYTDAFFAPARDGAAMPIEHRLLYYESTRGCPFSCAYCLSGADKMVRRRSVSQVRRDLETLAAHGARRIKFVDRTFNADGQRARAIIQNLPNNADCVFHFEAAADLFDGDLLAAVAALPPGRVQFEIGVQSTNPDTLTAVRRQTNLTRVFSNLRALTAPGNCHVHVDLIVGLPHETTASLALALHRCLDVRPHMLQVGFLKMLPGAPLRADAARWGYVYDEAPPYETLQNDCMSFADIRAWKRVCDVIERFYNTGWCRLTLQYARRHVFADWFSFFSGLAAACEHPLPPLTMKRTYALLAAYLLRAGAQREAVEHHITLDCLSHDPKGLLPDGFRWQRDKAAEQAFARHDPRRPLRAAFFPYDGHTRVFAYETRDPVTGAYPFYIYPLAPNGF